MESLGTTNPDFAQGLTRQIVNAGSQGKEAGEEGSNFVLSVIAGIEPRDLVEAMLAIQMAAVHLATMTFSRRLAHVENLQQQDVAEKAFNELASPLMSNPAARLWSATSAVGSGRLRMPINPMNKAHAAPRCSATSNRSGLSFCAPALKG